MIKWEDVTKTAVEIVTRHQDAPEGHIQVWGGLARERLPYTTFSIVGAGGYWSATYVDHKADNGKVHKIGDKFTTDTEAKQACEQKARDLMT